MNGTFLILAIIGAILGGVMLGGYFGGVIIGALLGLFAGWGLKLRQQLDDLHKELNALRQSVKPVDKAIEDTKPEVAAKERIIRPHKVKPEAPAVKAKAIPPVAKTVSEKPVETKPVETKPDIAKPVVPPARPVPPEPVVPPARKTPPSEVEHRPPKAAPSPPRKPPPKPPPKQPPKPQPKPPPKPPPTVSEPNPLVELVGRWVFGGNPLVKIGVVILFLGLGFALRYAAELGLLPLWLRYAAVAATGMALIVFGWRWRGREDNYGLILQGTGVGVLYLTTLAAMKLHPLLPMGPGFALLFLVAVLAAFLAVMEDAMILAVVAALGGFAAPVLASTGAGNHIILFSYLTVLNLGIVAIAWFRGWRVLNILGYVCSFGLGSTWAAEHYRNELFSTTEPFLLLLFGLYVLITVLFARRTLADAGESDASTLVEHVRETSRQVKYVDGSLAFGVPFSAFWLQHLLVEPYQYGTAISAIGFSLFYFLLAFVLVKGTGKRYFLLNETLIALGAIFGTLAIPLLETDWTAAAWAVEAAGVYWIGYRQRQVHVRLFAFLVLIGSAVYFLPELRLAADGTVLDGPVLSAALLTISTGFVYWLMWRSGSERLNDFEKGLRPILVCFGAAMLATIPLLLFAREWAAPALAIIGAALIYLSARLSDKTVLGVGYVYQLAGGLMFLTTLEIARSGTVLEGPILSAALLTVSAGFVYWLMRRAEPERPYCFRRDLRPLVVVYGAATLASIPLLIFAREWAAPVLAIIGTALIYLSTRLSDRTMLGAGWVYQLLAGLLFLTTLESPAIGTVLDGPTATAVLLTINAGLIYWLMRRAEAESSNGFVKSLRTLAVVYAAAMLATIPLLVLAREWAAPALAVLGTALIYLSVRLPDRAVLGAGWIYQLAGGLLFLTTLETATSGAVLADGWLGLLGTCLVGTALLAGAAVVAPDLFTFKSRDDASETEGTVSLALLAGLAFINLAPLFVLSWRMSAMIWPVVGIATLFWAVRTRHNGILFFSLGLQVIAGFFHLRTWVVGDVVPALVDDAAAFMNSGFLGPLVIALAGFVCARLMHGRADKEEFDDSLGWIAIAWGGLWWVFAWISEITRVVPDADVTAALIAVTLATAWTGSLLSQRLNWSQLGEAVLVYLPALVILGARDVFSVNGHPGAGWGALAWPAALVMHGLLLKRQKTPASPQLLRYAHTIGAWFFIVLATVEVRWWLLQWFTPETAWPLVGSMLVPALYVWAMSRQKVQGLWPVREFFATYVMIAAFPLVVYLLGWLWLTNLNSTGNAQPLTYLPILNPLELAYMAVLGSVYLWWRIIRAREERLDTKLLANSVLAVTAFAAVTGGVIRACHHWANVPWDLDALFVSDTVQASLSIVWGTLAISLMLFGNRRRIRIVWIIGVVLVSVVVAKLFLIELSAVGTLQRIVSFIVVGLLLLLVGYLAPLPPREVQGKEK